MKKQYIGKLKKSTATLLVLVALTMLCMAAALATSPTYAVLTSVQIGEDGFAEFDIRVSITGIYAGAQFELILDRGISIERVSFDKGRNAGVIPPTFARGSYFFSLISGTNEYEGDLICTVRISYNERVPANITVAGIQSHYIISRGNVSTSTDSTRSTILVNPYIPPTPSPAPQSSPVPSGDGRGQSAPGGQGAGGVGQQTDEDGQDEIEVIPEFDFHISDDPDDAAFDGVGTPDDGDIGYTDIGDEQTPLAELLGERYLTWIWIIVITFVTAVVAGFISEIKRRRSQKQEAAADAPSDTTVDNIKDTVEENTDKQ